MNPAIRFTSILALCLALATWTTACTRTDREAEVTNEMEPQVRVSQVELGRAVGTDNRITDPTDEFQPDETIYATVITNGNGQNTELTARWIYQDGQVVEETTQVITPTQDAAEFHVSKPDGWPAGTYKVEVLVNGTPAASKEFEVKTQS